MDINSRYPRIGREGECHEGACLSGIKLHSHRLYIGDDSVSIFGQPGDIVFFWGTGLLSWSIEFLTKGPSHCGILIDPRLVTDDGAGQGGPYLAESTRNDGKDGVRVSSLPNRIAEYDKGGAIAIARLDTKTSSALDYEKMWNLLYARVDRDRYNAIELAEYLARRIPFVEYIPAWNDPGREYCSQLVGMMLATSLPGIHPFLSRPRDFFEMRLYSSLEWLHGTPRKVNKFNTV